MFRFQRITANELVFFENQIFHVFCPHTGDINLCKTIIPYGNCIVIVKILYHLGTLIDIDHRSAPFSITTIVKYIVGNPNVTNTAAFKPSHRVRFKLNSCASTVEVVSQNLNFSFCRNQHTSGTIVANDVVANQCVGLIR